MKRAPAWLKRPAGVAFGFGNRLVSFKNISRQGQAGEHVDAGIVTLSHVSTLEHAVHLGTHTQTQGDISHACLHGGPSIVAGQWFCLLTTVILQAGCRAGFTNCVSFRVFCRRVRILCDLGMIIMLCMVQVATENDLIGRSEAFEQAMNENALAQFCDYKVANSDGDDQETWLYLRILFEADPKRHVSYLQFMSHRLTNATLALCCWFCTQACQTLACLSYSAHK